MQQIYRRIPMLKCNFNKVQKQLYWNRTSAWVFSCTLAAYFQKTFSWGHLWTAASNVTFSRNAQSAIVTFKTSVCNAYMIIHPHSIMVFIEITLRYGCSSVKLLHICRTTIFKNTFGRLPLNIASNMPLQNRSFP